MYLRGGGISCVSDRRKLPRDLSLCNLFFLRLWHIHISTLTHCNNARARTHTGTAGRHWIVCYIHRCHTHESRCSFSSRDYTNSRAAWTVIRAETRPIFSYYSATPRLTFYRAHPARSLVHFFIPLPYPPESRVLPCDHLSFSPLLFLTLWTLTFYPSTCLIDSSMLVYE